MEKYDIFVQQLQYPNQPPHISDVQLTIGKPYADGRLLIKEAGQNSGTSPPRSWEAHACIHEVTVEEMKRMYLFARERLYERFRIRLRQQCAENHAFFRSQPSRREDSK